MIWKVLTIVLLVSIAVGIVVEHSLTNTQIRTINDIRSSNASGGTVAIRGMVTYAEDNRFVLDDGTGKVELSTCPLWHKRIPLYEGEEITAIGQVMKNHSLAVSSDFTLSVYKIIRGSEVIQVRRRPGKPPWATYRNPDSSGAASWR